MREDLRAGWSLQTHCYNKRSLFSRRSLRLNNVARPKITALGTYVPPRVMTNRDFEKIVETSDEWITSRTGIRERHVVGKGVATSDLATEAAKLALAERGIDAGEIEAIVVATVTPDMLFPSTA